MAVTLEIDNLKLPVGELDASLFPDTDMTIDVALTDWLIQAITKVEADSDIGTADQNTAAAAWVYYRAYTYIAQWMAALPSSATVDGMSRTTAGDQRAHFAKKAQEWLDVFGGFNAPTVRTAFFGLARAGRRHAVSYYE